MHAPAPPEGAPPLRLPTKLAYGLGQAAEGIKNYSFEWFLFFYFSQVLGLRASLAGAAMAVTLVFDAATDPIVGSLSDGFRHRWGRRLPFLYASALPLGVSFWALFSPPAGLGQLGLFLWLTLGSIAVRSAMALYHVPHLALGAELSNDYQERTGIVGYRLMFAVAGSLAVAWLGWTVFFAKRPGFENGQLDAAAYPGFGLVFGAVMTVVIVASSLGTHSRIPWLPGPPERGEPVGLARIRRELGEALRNRSFFFLFVGVVIFFVTRGVQQTLGLHMFTYFWKLDPAEIKRVLLAMVLAFAFGLPVWALVSGRIDKKPTLLTGIVWFSVLNLLPPAAALAGMWPEAGSPGYLGGLLACMALAAFGGAGGLVAAGSMMADVADEHELSTGRRQEGIFFGAISFSGKAASGVGHLIAGAALELIAFPKQAAPSEVPAELLRSLGIVYGPGIMVLAIVALPFLVRYRLDRARHAEIKSALEERRLAGGSTPAR
jgi:Na+/melibiose symporter-like transporter